MATLTNNHARPWLRDGLDDHAAERIREIARTIVDGQTDEGKFLLRVADVFDPKPCTCGHAWDEHIPQGCTSRTTLSGCVVCECENPCQMVQRPPV